MNPSEKMNGSWLITLYRSPKDDSIGRSVKQPQDIAKHKTQRKQWVQNKKKLNIEYRWVRTDMLAKFQGHWETQIQESWCETTCTGTVGYM